MTRRITALLVAAATALSLISGPARAADPEDVARFIGAATTLYLLGRIIEEARDDEKRSSQHKATRHQSHKPQQHQQQARHRGQGQGHGHGGHRARPPLPSQCLRDSPVAGTRYVMRAPCLNQTYPGGVSRLPSACRVQVHRNGRTRYPFSVRCLRHRGFTIR